MRRVATRVIAAAALCVAASGFARSEPYLVLSFGTSTCGAFIKSDRNYKTVYLSWTLGFISGVNSRSDGQQRRVGDWENDSAMLWLENFCTNDPLALFVAAASGLRDALAKKKNIPPLE